MLRALVFGMFFAGAAIPQGGITTGGNTQRPIYVSGMVVMDDGSPLESKADIQLVCQNQVQPQGKTDADGKFTVELGRDRHIGANDASIGSAASNPGFGGALSGQTQVDGASIVSLMGCSLRASLKGYRSDTFDLSRVRAGEPVDAGRLVLHTLASSKDLTVSAASLKAPKDAQKSFQKGREALGARKPEEAEKAFRKAVETYPAYAEAWQELGTLLQAQNKPVEAREAFLQAVAGDAAFAKPYLSLARLSAVEKKWQETADRASALIQMSPNAYPQAYYYQAVAEYNLGSKDKALESARRAVELDVQHSVPLAEQLLGVIYGDKGDFASAAEQFRNYIQHVPPGSNVEAVKALLAETEKKIK